MTTDIQVLDRESSEFPLELRADDRWLRVYGLGNRDILKEPRLGLICSKQCPGSIVIETFDAIRQLRDERFVVIGGFHSPMEKECLGFLLRGEQPAIACPARHPPTSRLSSDWKRALDSGRLLLLSPFSDNVRRASTATARVRNEFVATLSTALLVPFASQGGNAEETALNCLKRCKRVFTFDDEGKTSISSAGALPYSLEMIADHLRGPAGAAPRRKKSEL